MRTITTREAQRNFAKVIEIVLREPVLIQRQRHDVAVLMSVTEYERLVHCNAAIFQRFSDHVGAKARKAGMTEGVLRGLFDHAG